MTPVHPAVKAVYAAALADRHDPHVRLALADALEEHGGPGDDAWAAWLRRPASPGVDDAADDALAARESGLDLEAVTRRCMSLGGVGRGAWYFNRDGWVFPWVRLYTGVGATYSFSLDWSRGLPHDVIVRLRFGPLESSGAKDDVETARSALRNAGELAAALPLRELYLPRVLSDSPQFRPHLLEFLERARPLLGAGLHVLGVDGVPLEEEGQT